MRLEQVFTDLEAAKDLLKTNKYNAAANRAYGKTVIKAYRLPKKPPKQR